MWALMTDHHPGPARRLRNASSSDQTLFAWDCLEDSSTLKAIRQLLDIIPDDRLLESIPAARGKGRDNIPVHIAWGVFDYR